MAGAATVARARPHRPLVPAMVETMEAGTLQRTSSGSSMSTRTKGEEGDEVGSTSGRKMTGELACAADRLCHPRTALRTAASSSMAVEGRGWGRGRGLRRRRARRHREPDPRRRQDPPRPCLAGAGTAVGGRGLGRGRGLRLRVVEAAAARRGGGGGARRNR